MADSTLSISSCNASGNNVTARIQSTQATVSDTVINIQILDGIINPPSTFSNAFSIYIYDTANNVKDFNNLININFTPGVLNSKELILNIDVGLTSSSNISGAVAELIVTFTPGQPILKDGRIRITFPFFNDNSGAVDLYPIISTDTKPSLIVISVIGYLKIGY